MPRRVLTDRQGLGLALAGLPLLVGATAVVRLTEPSSADPARAVVPPATTPAAPTTATTPPTSPPTSPTPAPAPAPAPIPGSQQWTRGIFGEGRFLVAYYGTAGTGALGVLGETSPEVMHRRLQRAARPFAARGRPVQEVYELIVTIADRSPGKDRDFAHDLPRADVRRYIEAAHRNHALLLLDVQPGRTPFDVAARRWEWALRDPSVGLALDPEWRMQGHDVPGHVIGRVGSSEINRTSMWLSDLVRREGLPQKLFVLHQFRRDMIHRIDRVGPRPGLAMVQHVDGFGTPAQKRATYHAVARPGQFVMGFKLFYDEDVHRLGPAAVHRIRPTVRFVSFQ